MLVIFRQRKPREPKAPKAKKQKQEILSAKQKKKVVSKQFISSSEDNSSSDDDELRIDVARGWVFSGILLYRRYEQLKSECF